MKDNLWFTYKARINAQARLAWLGLHSQLLLVWYALVGASVAVVSVRYPQVVGVNTDIFSALLSIGLLTVSLIVASLDFRGRSMAMRNNYLELQRLYDHVKCLDTPTESDVNRYHDLLSAVENHSEIDDKLFRTFHTGELRTRRPTRNERFVAYAYLVVRWLVVGVLYLAPIAVWFVL